MRFFIVATAVAAAGCSVPYTWDARLSLAENAPGTFAETDCLDLRVVPEATVGCGEVRLAYAFGNRCDRLIHVDLGAAKVEGEDEEGRILPLTRRAPPAGVSSQRGELDMRASASASIRYDAAPGACVRAVCVDLAPVAPGMTTGRTCFPIAAPDPPAPAPVVTEMAPAWDRDTFPPLFFEIGGGRQPISLRGRSIHDNAIGSFSTDGLGTLDSYFMNLRTGLRIVGPLYAGAEFRVGLGSVGSHSLQADPAVTLSGLASALDGRAFAGVVSPRLGPVRAHAEAFVGARLLAFKVSEHFDCKERGCASLSTTDVPIGGRVGLDVFVVPTFSVGGWAAVDTRDPSPVFGLSVTFHAHGFDGRP